MADYRMCIRCVMDTTADEITFDEDGVCSFCSRFDGIVKPILDRARSGEAKRHLELLTSKIRAAGSGRPYDCVLGISGGTDSSYLAHLAKELGLRPLAVHVDTGWNSPESEQNVTTLVEQLGFAFETIHMDWEEMKDLQLAFYKASVMNCEIPQDHVFLAALYRKANRAGLRHILTGGNYATESVLPQSWGYDAGDRRHVIAIQRRFGSRPLRRLPTLGFWRRYLYYPLLRQISEVRPLNYVDYRRSEAKATLASRYGWQDYGLKHYESVLTRFFQGYYLPAKFGVDKRRAHLSSLILSGEIDREHALGELRKPAYPSDQLLNDDKAYIAAKLGLSVAEWEQILSLPPRDHRTFPTSGLLFGVKDAAVTALGIRKRRYGLR